MRCAIYARVSTNDGRQDAENQLLQLREFAAKQGWEISREYIDQASGKSIARRDEFKQLLADAEARQFDAVLVWALDRLTREGYIRTFGCIVDFDRWGVHFYSFTEPQFSHSNPCWGIMVSIAAWVAEQERTRISDRTKAGLARIRGFNLWDHEKEIKALKGKMSVREAAELLKTKYSLTVDPRMTVHRIWKG